MSNIGTPKLTELKSFNTSNMIFSKIQINNIPNTSPQMSYKRINILTKYFSGAEYVGNGELLVKTEPLFSYGVSESTAPGSSVVNGYTMPLVLTNKDAPTESETRWVDGFNKICLKCKEHVYAIREELGMFDLTPEDSLLRKINPIYYKKDKGKIVEGSAPTLYVKLLPGNGKDITKTVFVDMDTNARLDPQSILRQRCVVTAVIKIESVFIGSKIALQVKLREARVRLLDKQGFMSLLGDISEKHNDSDRMESAVLEEDDDELLNI